MIFLKNHGFVIGGAHVAEVNQIMNGLTLALCTSPADISPPSRLMSMRPATLFDQYTPVADVDIHQLVLNPDLFKRLSSDWALYPDHVVFLGPRAYTYRTWEALNDEENAWDLPELVFIQG